MFNRTSRCEHNDVLVSDGVHESRHVKTVRGRGERGGVVAFPLYNSTTPRQEGCGKKGEREREREREKPLWSGYSGYVELRQSRDVHAERIARCAGASCQRARAKVSAEMLVRGNA